jgi:uncharacterized protein YciI
MPYFALTYITVENFTEKRTPFREQHLALAQAYYKKNILIAGGSMHPAIESLLIFHCETEEVIKTFMGEDPYVQNGLVKAWYIREWKVVIGDQFMRKEV